MFLGTVVTKRGSSTAYSLTALSANIASFSCDFVSVTTKALDNSLPVPEVVGTEIRPGQSEGTSLSYT